MRTLALHIGDLELRVSHYDGINAPTLLEDLVEPTRYLTPSAACIDAAGILFGYPALQHAATPAAATRWRYRRATLGERRIVASDNGRGLSSEGFCALAVRKLAREARTWFSAPPQLALVVPSGLAPAARAALAVVAAQAAEQPVLLVGEDRALLHDLDLAATATCLILSFDDDALRLRAVRRQAQQIVVLAEEAVTALGQTTMRQAWLARWNDEAAALLAAETAFGDGDNYEFERLWQDIWDCLDTAPADQPRMPTWPLLRASRLLPLNVARASLVGEIEAMLQVLPSAVERVLAQAALLPADLASVAIVGAPALTRAAAARVAAAPGLDKVPRSERPASIYARSAARLLGDGAPGEATELSVAPHGLGVVGVDKDGTTLTMRTVVARGSALPAEARFAVVANRDIQRRLTISVGSEGSGGGAPVVTHKFEFGPLLGQGLQPLTVVVRWGRDGRVAVEVVETDGGRALPCIDWAEIAGNAPLFGPAQFLQCRING